MHTDQRATVLTDVECDEFGVARGTKQGDPLSSLFFNSGLQLALEAWKEKGLGIKLSDDKRDCISDLFFTDDVLMMASSLKQFKRMFEDFKKVRQHMNPHKPETN